jgi:hypothetical protein
MDDLPEELFFLIMRKCRVRDVINIRRVCKNYKFIVDIDDEILEIASQRCNNKLIYDNLYSEYTQGKSLSFLRSLAGFKVSKDIPFKVSEFEYILYQAKVSSDVAYYYVEIITINNVGNYIRYTFDEALDAREVSPEYYGYDDDDYDQYLISNTKQYNSLKEVLLSIKKHLSNNVISNIYNSILDI